MKNALHGTPFKRHMAFRKADDFVMDKSGAGAGFL
jgi:hypothetical protein